MIESTVIRFLEKHLAGVKVCGKEPESPPGKMVVVDKTGGGKEGPGVFDATIVVQSYGPTKEAAMLLNEEVKEAMEHLAELDDISSCELNTDYPYTDTRKKRDRYQAVFDIVHY